MTWKWKERTVRVDSVPEGLRWKPVPGGSKNQTVLASMGNIYYLIRDRRDGTVEYYQTKDIPKISPAEKIDAEPKRKRARFALGVRCWFVNESHWFLVEVVRREGERMAIKPLSELDADRQMPWKWGDILEFRVGPTNPTFRHLRALRERYH